MLPCYNNSQFTHQAVESFVKTSTLVSKLNHTYAIRCHLLQGQRGEYKIKNPFLSSVSLKAAYT